MNSKISSMTGFATRSLQAEMCELQWDIRSLNHRSMDLHVKLPEQFRTLEPECRRIIGENLSRGRVDAVLRFNRAESQQSPKILNLAVLSEFLQNVDTVREQIPDLLPPSALDILKWPDMFKSPDYDIAELNDQILKLLSAAVEDLDADRKREGNAIYLVIDEHIREFRSNFEQGIKLLPVAKENVNARLAKKIDELKIDVDPVRLEQEVALVLVKMDVSEEMDRIRCHIEELSRVLNSNEEVGKRMNFLVQELGREVNTSTSKTTLLEFTSVMVELKVLLEKIREQIQNLV